MKRNNTKGWQDVFRVTVAQNIKNKAFIVSTIVITLFIAVICVCVNLLPGLVMNVKSSKEKEMKIDAVYINDQSGLNQIDYQGMLSMKGKPKKIQINQASSIEEVGTEKKSVYVEINNTATGYDVVVTVPKESEVKDKDATAFGNMTAEYFQTANQQTLGISEEQAALYELGIDVSVNMLGEAKLDMIVILVEYFVNLAMIMLFVLLINSYGKMTSNVVAMEKSSKVLELLLTSVRPLATILGKVIAMTILLLGQLVLWIIVGCVTFYGSNAVLSAADSKYKDGLSKAMNLLGNAGITLQITPVRLILVVAIAITSFMVYISIAAFVGATVSKIEELGQAIQKFSLMVVLGSYIPLFGFINMVTTESMNTPLLSISRILPICNIYVVPAELILGTGTVSSALISLVINIAVLAVLTVFISKVYEVVILHTGNRLKLKDILKMAKN